MNTFPLANSLESIQSRLAEGRIPRYGPMLMLFARSAFILLAQGITFLLFLQLNVPNASVVIRNWWSVYGTLVDLGCLGLLIWLTRREGIRLQRPDRYREKQADKAIFRSGWVCFSVVSPVTIFGGGMLAMLIAYGSLNPEFPEVHIHPHPAAAGGALQPHPVVAASGLPPRK